MRRIVCTGGALLLWTLASAALVAQGNRESQGGKPDFEVEEVSQTLGVASQEKPIANSYIVILKADKHPAFTKGARKFGSRADQAAAAKAFQEREARKIMTLARAKYKLDASAVTEVYTSGFQGFAATIPDATAKGFMNASKSDSDVQSFYQDFEVSIDAVVEEVIPAEAMLAQTIPWGIDFVGWGPAPTDRMAWILDTGIDLDHPDLNVVTDPQYAVSFVKGRSPNDGNGHGTHVAGTIGAINNGVGVVGVAAGAKVVPVKVLSDRGSGSWSGILAGINHVYQVALPGDAMNLSLGGYGSNVDVESKLVAAGEKGIFVAIAAGNSNADAMNYTPARATGTNVFSISAMDNQCKLASFSNYGNPPVVYAAPGVNILSTYKGGAYASLNGTSMASPHVAGLYLLTGGDVENKGCPCGDGSKVCQDKDATPDTVVRKKQ
jgi:subtilisin family serine protease